MGMLKPPNGKVRYAVVGAGWFGQAAILPAFANATENSELAAIVSGDATKRDELSKKYKVPAVPYEEYDKLLESGAVDAVFVATPNSEHREHTLAAAVRGVHVLCEKPLADTSAAAEEMILECERSRVFLMTAYRLHFEKANQTAVELARSGKIGDPRLFDSVFTMKVEDEGNIRLKPELGGGPLHDIGVYCINAARYLFRGEPTEVVAFAAAGADPKFRGVPEMVTAMLRFPGERLATFAVGFGESKMSVCRLVGTTGDVRLEPAYSHSGERKLFLTIDGETEETTYKDRDQIGPEIVYFSNCLLTGERPEPDGREGLIDLRIIEAIQTSIDRKTPVAVPPVRDVSRPDGRQVIEGSRVKEQKLVNATAPTGN